MGVGSLLVGYTVCGAFIFQAIEATESGGDLIEEVEIVRPLVYVKWC